MYSGSIIIGGNTNKVGINKFLPQKELDVDGSIRSTKDIVDEK